MHIYIYIYNAYINARTQYSSCPTTPYINTYIHTYIHTHTLQLLSNYSEIGDSGPWDATEVGATVTDKDKGCVPLGDLGFPFAGKDYDSSGGIHIGANGYIRFGSTTGCAEVSVAYFFVVFWGLFLGVFWVCFVFCFSVIFSGGGGAQGVSTFLLCMFYIVWVRQAGGL